MGRRVRPLRDNTCPSARASWLWFWGTRSWPARKWRSWCLPAFAQEWAQRTTPSTLSVTQNDSRRTSVAKAVREEAKDRRAWVKSRSTKSCACSWKSMVNSWAKMKTRMISRVKKGSTTCFTRMTDSMISTRTTRMFYLTTMQTTFSCKMSLRMR